MKPLITLTICCALLCGCPTTYTPEQIAERQAAIQTISDAFAISDGVVDWETKLATLDETKVLNAEVIKMRRALALRRDKLLLEEAYMRGLDTLPDDYVLVGMELRSYTTLEIISQSVTPEQQIDVARVMGYLNLFATDMEKHVKYSTRIPDEITSVLSGSLPQVGGE